MPIKDGRCLFNKITNRNAKNVWILIQRPGSHPRPECLDTFTVSTWYPAPSWDHTDTEDHYCVDTGAGDDWVL